MTEEEAKLLAYYLGEEAAELRSRALELSGEGRRREAAEALAAARQKLAAGKQAHRGEATQVYRLSI